MMPLSISYLVIVAALTFLGTDAQISLQSSNSSQNSFICGKQQVLKCTIESYSSTMTWTKNTYPDPLATCSFSTCFVNPSMSADYSFTFDTDNGIFEMNILKVKVAENGTIYFCDNGFVFANVSSNVQVKPDCSIVKDNKTVDSQTTEVSVTTRCIPDNADVNFEWWIQEVSNTSSEKIKVNESLSVTQVTNLNNSVCIADPDCGVNGYSYVTNSVNMTDEGVGKNYSIGVDVTCDSITNVVTFDLFFLLNPTEPKSQNTTERVILTISELAIFLILMQLSIFGRYLYIYYIQNESMKRFVLLHLCSHVPLFGFFTSKYISNSLKKTEQNFDMLEKHAATDRKTFVDKLKLSCPNFWIGVFGSAPIIGLLVKVGLVLRKKKIDHLQGWEYVCFAVCWMFSMAFEILIILICLELPTSPWYALILVIFDLILRWMLFVFIAYLYYGDKDKQIRSHGLPKPSVLTIALWCMPIVGWLFNLLSNEAVQTANSTQGTVQNGNNTPKTVQNSHHTRITKQKATSTQNTMQKEKRSQDTVQKEKSSQDTMQKAKRTQDTVQNGNSTLKIVQNLNHTQITVQKATGTQDTMQKEKSSQDTVQKAKRTQDTVQNGNSTPKTVTNLNHTQIIVQKATSTQDTMQEEKSSQDTVQKDNRAQGTVQKSTSTQGTMQNGNSTPNPVQNSHHTQIIVQKATSTQGTMQKEKSSQDTVQKEKSSQDTMRKEKSSQDTLQKATGTQNTVQKEKSSQDNVQKAKRTQDTVQNGNSTPKPVQKANHTQQIVHNAFNTQKPLQESNQNANCNNKIMQNHNCTQETVQKANHTQTNLQEEKCLQHSPKTPLESHESSKSTMKRGISAVINPHESEDDMNN